MASVFTTGQRLGENLSISIQLAFTPSTEDNVLTYV